MASLAGRWKDLGISLGVHISDLDGIASANSHSPSDCLREMLTKWLKQSYNVRTHPLCLIYYTTLLSKGLETPSLPRLRGLESQLGEDWWKP